MIDVKEHTIFDHLGNVFVSKRNGLIREGDAFPFYMIQRWGSMHSAAMTLFLNDTVNINYKALEDPRMQYDFICAVTPKLKSSKWKYVKKSEKKEAVKKDFTNDEIKQLGVKLELSERDIRTMMEFDSKSLHELLEGTEVRKGRKIIN